MPIHLPPLSRREFVRRTLIAGAGWMAGSRLHGATPAVDEHLWALLSDSHVAADRAKEARGTNMAANLAAVVADVLKQPRRPAGALVNGDLAFNTGEDGDYAAFVDLVQPLRAGGIPLHLGLGNHDHRERFWAALRDEPSVPRPVADRHAALVRSARANWLVLDSLDQTNSSPGLLGETQLAWLAKTLDANPVTPALVMVHHNPVPTPDKKALIDEDALYAVIRPRRQVKAYVFGHSHRWKVQEDPSGIHLVNLPATGYVFDTAQPSGWVSARIEPRGMRLQLQCVDARRADHGQTVDLAWRV
jgi:Icc protein